MTINKTKLLENFRDIKSFMNINLLICYNNLFKLVGIAYNIGFYLISFITISHIISFFIFLLKKIRKIRKIINDIVFAIKNRKLIKSDKKNKDDEIIIEQALNRIDDKNNKKKIPNKRMKKSKKGKKGKKNKKCENSDIIDSNQIKSINI